MSPQRRVFYFCNNRICPFRCKYNNRRRMLNSCRQRLDRNPWHICCTDSCLYRPCSLRLCMLHNCYHLLGKIRHCRICISLHSHRVRSYPRTLCTFCRFPSSNQADIRRTNQHCLSISRNWRPHRMSKYRPRLA